MITRNWQLKARQQVHNALHHLEDCSLPHEQWNRETELAAIVALLRRDSTLVAARKFTNLVRCFVQSYRNLGINLGEPDEQRASESVHEVAEFRNSLPADYSDADIYVALLARETMGATA